MQVTLLEKITSSYQLWNKNNFKTSEYSTVQTLPKRNSLNVACFLTNLHRNFENILTGFEPPQLNFKERSRKEAKF